MFSRHCWPRWANLCRYLKDILIDERDQYLAEKIRTAPGQKIVAVVGAGHVPGIKKYWK